MPAGSAEHLPPVSKYPELYNAPDLTEGNRHLVEFKLITPHALLELAKCGPVSFRDCLCTRSGLVLTLCTPTWSNSAAPAPFTVLALAIPTPCLLASAASIQSMFILTVSTLEAYFGTFL